MNISFDCICKGIFLLSLEKKPFMIEKKEKKKDSLNRTSRRKEKKKKRSF